MTLTVKLAPVFNTAQLDNNGLPLAGGKLFWYLAGSSTPAAVYGDADAASAHSQPIVLNVRGEPPQPIWLPTGQAYKAVLTDAVGNTLRVVDQLSGINDNAPLLVEEWNSYPAAASFVDPGRFSVSGDARAVFTVNRRVRVSVPGGVCYATVTAASYLGGVTTVSLACDSLALSEGLSAVAYGFIDPALPSVSVFTARGSQAVGHQCDADAIKTSVFNILRERVKLTQYTGYAPDGSVDATAAVTKALSKFGSNGGVLQCAAGTYPLTGSVSVDSPVIIEGEGPGATLFSVNGDGFDALVFNAERSGLRGVGFSSPVARSAGNFCLVNGKFVSLRDFYFSNGCYGMTVTGVVTRIENGDIRNCTPTTGVGIFINGGNDTYIERVVMDTTGVDPYAGLYIRRSGGVWCGNSDFIHAGQGVLIRPQDGEKVDWCSFDNVDCDSCADDGIKIIPASGGRVLGVHFSQCWSSSNANRGVNIGADGLVDGLVMIGHRSLANGLAGYVVNSSNSYNVRFEGCVAAGNSTASPGASSGFEIGAHVSRFAIVNCLSGPSLNFGNSQARGILITAGGSDVYQIVGNDLISDPTGLLDLGSGNNKVISGNLGYTEQNAGTAHISTGQSSVTVNHGLPYTPLIQHLSITPTCPMGGNPLYLDSATLDATSFTVRTSSPVSGDSYFTWQARNPYP